MRAQGEVLAGLQQKMKYSDKDGFCCLVAASAADPARIVGVVEVSLQGEKVRGTVDGLNHAATPLPSRQWRHKRLSRRLVACRCSFT